MSNVPVTVLMPVYNASAHLREAIDSILNQTFTNFEFLIINDGSTDSSEEIILSYNDPRIRYEKNEVNIRLIATLNKGLEIAKGKYIARMDADDISLPERLQVQFDFMEASPAVALCGSWCEVTGSSSGMVKLVTDHNDIMMKMLYQSHLVHPTVMLRKSAIDSFTTKFDPQFLHAEDYEFFVRIGEKFKLACIPQVLLKYRVHEGSISIQNRDLQVQNSFIIKGALFQKLGATLTQDEMELYRSIGQHEYLNTDDYINKAQNILERLSAANNKTGFFDNAFFQKHISQLWFNLTYNVSTYSRYKSSALSTSYSPGAAMLAKFWLKSFGKKK
jgi:glycosyltransferase involved in cell wall biosynthesis